MTELHDFKWAEFEEPKRAGVTKFNCRDEKCKCQPHFFMTKELKLSIKAHEKPYVTLGEVECAILEWLLALQEENLLAETALREGDDWGCQTPLLLSDMKF
ncbi:hypothetical protein ColLi_00003 [Colletotrichum liriopes]|uniref:Uncharacterized protein n=1 Tax=Colletotrichum liriopes TaxID=708192 RepID=A0AA37GA98_9PEZI|nr:hypothetical protein ColLi_00003 [Colletotrichum liriopes]